LYQYFRTRALKLTAGGDPQFTPKHRNGVGVGLGVPSGRVGYV
jgi:hypothetical protein